MWIQHILKKLLPDFAFFLDFLPLKYASTRFTVTLHLQFSNDSLDRHLVNKGGVTGQSGWALAKGPC